MRRPTRVIKIGNLLIGGSNPIVVQSMTNSDTRDVNATLAQIGRLEAAGCELVRVAVMDQEAAAAIARIKAGIGIPLVADIHFDHRLAIRSVEAGADGLRINPGNIGSPDKVRELVRICQERSIPVRIGVNAGSLDKQILARYGGICAQGMVDSAMDNVKLLQDLDFHQIKISLKASSVLLTIEAYRLMADLVDYPLHVGVTEAGTMYRGLVKSALGVGLLLSEGIGDTVRISLTADPVEEVWAAYEILRSLGLRKRGVELISCPSCGRCEIDLIQTAEAVDSQVRFMDKAMKVAVMGCVVNGPGEAREADVGIAGGRGFGLLIKHGEIVDKIPQDQMVPRLIQEIKDYEPGKESN
ncbi:MAG: flavodoxin-dependent (E)-4-hydroxy-3-methylbut-2-enyl-diphosphate synthase [Syntrophomonadaceae bacterium]|nr:flavodoxin-dependent (E)-4-hydroxy-3-methylbut-2-enyl-diphosphate synthase [Syntrophomonadaceae bacterium]